MAQPGKKVTDFAIGLSNVCRAASFGIYDLENSDPNTLCLSMFPRYVHAQTPSTEDDSDDPSPLPIRVNSATVLGDIFSAISHLEAEIRGIKKTLDEHSKISNEVSKIDHIIEHVQVLENNLRCIHETVSYDGYTVPPLQQPG